MNERGASEASDQRLLRMSVVALVVAAAVVMHMLGVVVVDCY